MTRNTRRRKNSGIAEVVHPVGFIGYIKRVIEPRRVDKWIVGKAAPFPKRSRFTLFRPSDPARQEWFELFLREYSSIADGVSLVSRFDAFRKSDWIKVKHALSTQGLPREVKQTIRKMGLGKEQEVYLLYEEHIWQEVQLLKCLAQVAGVRTHALLKALTKEGHRLLEKLCIPFGQFAGGITTGARTVVIPQQLIFRKPHRQHRLPPL